MEQPGDDVSNLQSSLNSNPELYREPEKERGPRSSKVRPAIKPKPEVSKDTRLVPKQWITAEIPVSNNNNGTLEPEANLQSERYATPKVSPEFRNGADTAARTISESNSTINPIACSRPRSGNEEYGGSDGYLRVYKGDRRVPQCGHTFDDMSSEESDENVEIDTKIGPGVQHLHIHINLKFMKDDGRIRCRNSKSKEMQFQGKNVGLDGHDAKQNRNYTEQTENIQSRSQSVTNSLGSPLFNLAAPPVPPKTYKIPPKGPEVDKDGYVLRQNQDNSEDLDETTEYEQYKEQAASSMVYTRRNRDYDEISFKDMLPDISSSTVSEEVKTSDAKKDEKSEEEERHSWLFHHTQKRKAEENIKTSQIGSFAVIEEDIERKPFTPYTLLVASNDRLRKVPVIKQGKKRYTLANAVGLKLASIQDLVAYYQRHDLPELKHKLRPLD